MGIGCSDDITINAILRHAVALVEVARTWNVFPVINESAIVCPPARTRIDPLRCENRLVPRYGRSINQNAVLTINVRFSEVALQSPTWLRTAALGRLPHQGDPLTTTLQMSLCVARNSIDPAIKLSEISSQNGSE